MRNSFLASLLFVSFLLPSSAHAQTSESFYVSKNGDGSTGRTWSQAWRELADINWGLVGPGDTVFIDGGSVSCPTLGPGYNCGMVYNSTLSIDKDGTSTSPITIRLSSEPGRNGTVIIDGGINQWAGCPEYPSEPAPPATGNGQGERAAGIKLNNSSWIILDGTKWGGIEVRNHNTYGIDFDNSQNSIVTYTKVHHNTHETDTSNNAVGVTQDHLSRNNTLSKSEIFKNGQDATRGAGDSFTMEENYIHDHYCNHPDGFQAFIQNGNAGMEGVSGLIDNLVIRRNVFERVGLQPIFMGENNIHDSWVENAVIENNLLIDGHDMIKTKNGKTRNVTIRNNTLYHSTGWAIEWCCANPGAIAPMTVTNNVFYNTPDGSDPNRQSSFYFGGMSTTFSNNCLVNPRGSIPSGTGNVTTSNPQFVNPSSGNYALSSSSVCAGKGSNLTSLSQLVSTDVSSANIWIWNASSGTISAPFTTTSSYIFQAIQTIDPLVGGRAAYNFSLSSSGQYILRSVVEAPDISSDSLFANIDTEPTTSAIWDVGITSGPELRTLTWRGAGTVDLPEFKPKIFNLASGNHTLIIRGREANTHLYNFYLLQLGDVNLDGSLDTTDIRQSLINYSSSSQTTDFNLDSKTSILDVTFSLP